MGRTEGSVWRRVRKNSRWESVEDGMWSLQRVVYGERRVWIAERVCGGWHVVKIDGNVLRKAGNENRWECMEDGM